MISGPFADALREGRERHNARFAAVRRAHPALSGERFGALLASIGDPLVRAIHAHDASRARASADAIHDVLLELVAREIDRTHPAVLEVLVTIATKALRTVADHPRRTLASVVNATHRIAEMRPAGVSAWRARVERVAEASAATPDALLDALAVAAWGAGIPMLRAAALDALARLPEEVALAALALPRSEIPIAELARKLAADPWSTPARLAMRSEPAPQFVVAAIAGGFRGFGGPFEQPPRAEVRHARLYAASGDDRYVVWADRMGSWLEACAASGPASGTTRESIALRGDGRVEGFGQRSAEPIVDRPIASWAAYERTLIAIPRRSHHVVIVALAEST